ncbi:transcription factor IIIC subunit delta N-term-domain-containing protein [Zychaea mexicana]|uniref:transcription factor IIIC subunit delta N-term-domain-containing protein n=1 Tax=Zychaea mexicana TaxID=64656 RepID=UPI0022FE889F|nr:transcription factor IIIC subunit delta N-term-domain-containing protein [Zychaea mexicana]KAI9498009.1 transcription factor IIIC subunit delta N-term-domain-containing protein [Zychaea mexicana]
MEFRPAISLLGQPYFHDALQWSEDDQIAICLRTGIHIVTPTFVDLRSEEEAHVHTGLIELRKGNPDAPAETTVKDKPVQSSFLIAEAYRCARWSPTGLSQMKRCILAVITTQHQVTLYSAPNPREYFETCLDMTPLIKDHVLGSKDRFDTLEELDRFHTLCCAWSPRIIPDAFNEKPALIALGNKAGEITLWSYHSASGAQFCTTVQPHQSFVNLVEWSHWRIHGSKHTAYLISTCTDGTAALSTVEVVVSADDAGKTVIQSVVATVAKTWFESDPATISVLSIWDNLKSENGKTIRVALCKNARVDILSMILDDDDDIADHQSEYYLEHTVMGLSGARWATDGTQLQMYTYDLQCVVLDVDDHAKYTYNKPVSAQTNERLVNKANHQWILEQDKMDRETLATANAVTPKLWSTAHTTTGLFTAVLFTLRSSRDINYYGSGYTDLIYLGFLLHRERQDDKIIEGICDTVETYAKDPEFFFTSPVQQLLHESLQYIVDEDDNKAVLRWLEKLDELMSQGQYNKSISTDSLARRLFFDERTTAARILVRAELDLKNYDLTEEASRKLASICSKAKSFLKQQFAVTTLDHILNLPKNRLQKLNDEDIMVILLFCDRILAQQEPILFALEQVQMTCKDLIQSYISDPSQKALLQREMDTAIDLLDGNDLKEPLPGRETCPGCQQLLTIKGDRLAAVAA